MMKDVDVCALGSMWSLPELSMGRTPRKDKMHYLQLLGTISTLETFALPKIL